MQGKRKCVAYHSVCLGRVCVGVCVGGGVLGGGEFRPCMKPTPTPRSPPRSGSSWR